MTARGDWTLLWLFKWAVSPVFCASFDKHRQVLAENMDFCWFENNFYRIEKKKQFYVVR